MKVRLLVEVDAHARFVIAKYFAPASDGRDHIRRRATRKQVRRFALAALRSAVREQVMNLRGRARGAATKLERPAGHRGTLETLVPPDEEQRSIPW